MGRRKPGEISDVQFARMTEREVWKLLTGPSGALEVSWPGSDDERIDMETHIKWTFGLRLALQIKAHSWLRAPASRQTLVFNLDEKVERVHSHPLFWYLFGYFPVKRLAFQSPLFLVESERFHREADPRVDGETIKFQFQASMKPDSRDRWVDCRVEPLQLAQRVATILQRAQGDRGLLAATPPPILPGSLVIGFKRAA